MPDKSENQVEGPQNNLKNTHDDRRSEGLDYSIKLPGTELFMQDSVVYKTGKLREVCQGNRFINFIIIRNSDATRNQTYEFCNQGVLKNG